MSAPDETPARPEAAARRLRAASDRFDVAEFDDDGAVVVFCRATLTTLVIDRTAYRVLQTLLRSGRLDETGIAERTGLDDRGACDAAVAALVQHGLAHVT